MFRREHGRRGSWDTVGTSAERRSPNAKKNMSGKDEETAHNGTVGSHFDGQIDVLYFNDEQLKVLASSAATEVFSTLSEDQPRSIREVAAEMGKSPPAVGEQMAKLVQADLVISAGTRRSHARTETLYVHRARVNRVAFGSLSPEGTELYLNRFRAMSKLSERQHEAFIRAIPDDPDLANFARTLRGSFYLTKDQAARLREACEAVYQLANSMHEPDPSRRTEGHVRIAFSSAFFPTTQESEKRRKKRQ